MVFTLVKRIHSTIVTVQFSFNVRCQALQASVAHGKCIIQLVFPSSESQTTLTLLPQSQTSHNCNSLGYTRLTGSALICALHLFHTCASTWDSWRSSTAVCHLCLNNYNRTTRTKICFKHVLPLLLKCIPLQLPMNLTLLGRMWPTVNKACVV